MYRSFLCSYVSDASDEGEAEASGGAKLAEDQEGIVSSVPKVGSVGGG